MPDASGGIASGLYWVVTGKMPIEDVEGEKSNGKDNEKDNQKDKRRKA